MKELTPLEWLEKELTFMDENKNTTYIFHKIYEAQKMEAKQKTIEAKKNFLEGFKASVEALNELYESIENEFKNHKV